MRNCDEYKTNFEQLPIAWFKIVRDVVSGLKDTSDPTSVALITHVMGDHHSHYPSTDPFDL